MTEGRVRWRFALEKGEELRFISHLDMARHLVRALRRARLPVVFSQGFSPRPRVQFGVPLPVGATSRAELLDVIMEGEGANGVPAGTLGENLPAGLRVLGAWRVGEREPALGVAVGAVSYRVTGFCRSWRLAEVIREFLGEDVVEWELMARGRRERSGKRRIDIRKAVMDLSVTGGEESVLEMTLAAGDGGVSPGAVLSCLANRAGWDRDAPERLKVTRMGQFSAVGGELVSLSDRPCE